MLRRCCVPGGRSAAGAAWIPPGLWGATILETEEEKIRHAHHVSPYLYCVSGGRSPAGSAWNDRGRTARGGHYTGTDTTWLHENGLPGDAFNMKIGQSKATVGASFYNAVYPLGGGAQLYSSGGLSYRRGRATGFYRLPGSQPERVVFELYPDGFLPQINPDIEDRSFSAGVRGARGAWDVDFSLTRGGNSFQWNIENTNNASMGAASPVSFDAGRLGFSQTSGNLDLVRPLKLLKRSKGRPWSWGVNSASRTTGSRPASSSPIPWAMETRAISPD